MNLRFYLALWAAKITGLVLKFRGGGSALPGLLALKLDQDFLKPFRSQFKQGVILVSGTNGKTTTASLVTQILADQNLGVIHNSAGSNLQRGLASTLSAKADLLGKVRADWGVFEVDEAAVPSIAKIFMPKAVILLNIFRDQLDRYGEIDATADSWQTVLDNLDENSLINSCGIG